MNRAQTRAEKAGWSPRPTFTQGLESLKAAQKPSANAAVLTAGEPTGR